MTRPLLHATDLGGSGDLLVLGPSLGTSTLLWQEAARLLAERFRIIGWDLPGHGRSPAATAPFSLGELADAVAELTSQLSATRFLYAGDSVGGAVGLELGLRHPECVVALADICSAAKFGTSEAWAERAAVARSQGTAALVVQSAQRWFAPGSIEERPEVSQALLRALRTADDESYALVCEALAVFDVRERLGAIATPLLVLVGAHDAAVPEEDSRLVADGVRGARFEVIPDAGHLVPAEQPELAATALSGFFAEAAA